MIKKVRKMSILDLLKVYIHRNTNGYCSQKRKKFGTTVNTAHHFERKITGLILPGIEELALLSFRNSCLNGKLESGTTGNQDPARRTNSMAEKSILWFPSRIE
jgi:hypothetical protein